MSDTLEQDFEALGNQINEKIKQAAKLMEEARKLAADAGVNSLTFDEYGDGDQSDLHDWVNINPLFNQLDQAGWRTSSIGC